MAFSNGSACNALTPPVHRLNNLNDWHGFFPQLDSKQQAVSLTLLEKVIKKMGATFISFCEFS